MAIRPSHSARIHGSPTSSPLLPVRVPVEPSLRSPVSVADCTRAPRVLIPVAAQLSPEDASSGEDRNHFLGGSPYSSGGTGGGGSPPECGTPQPTCARRPVQTDHSAQLAAGRSPASMMAYSVRRWTPRYLAAAGGANTPIGKTLTVLLRPSPAVPPERRTVQPERRAVGIPPRRRYRS